MITSQDTYKLFAEYYDKYVRNFSEDLIFYLSRADKNEKIIEIGCGTGRILEYFLDNGYSITGVDISNEMIEKSRKKLSAYLKTGNLRILKHDFCVNTISEKFTLCLITFYTFNYILDNPLQFLKNIYNILHIKGEIIIDCFYPHTLNQPTINNKWIEKEFMADGKLIRIKDRRNYSDNIELRTQVFKENEKTVTIDTQRRYYSPDELKELLILAGFKNIQFSAIYDHLSFSDTIKENAITRNFVVKAEK